MTIGYDDGSEGLRNCMAKDRFHSIARVALEKQGWQITADPYEINDD